MNSAIAWRCAAGSCAVRRHRRPGREALRVDEVLGDVRGVAARADPLEPRADALAGVAERVAGEAVLLLDERRARRERRAGEQAPGGRLPADLRVLRRPVVVVDLGDPAQERDDRVDLRRRGRAAAASSGTSDASTSSGRSRRAADRLLADARVRAREVRGVVAAEARGWCGSRCSCAARTRASRRRPCSSRRSAWVSASKWRCVSTVSARNSASDASVPTQKMSFADRSVM